MRPGHGGPGRSVRLCYTRNGPFRSEVLVTGFADENGGIVLAIPERKVPDGTKLV